MLLFSFIAALFVKYFTRIFSFTSWEYQFKNIKKSSAQSLFVVTFVIMIILIYTLTLRDFLRELPELLIVLIQSVFYIIIAFIVIFAVLRSKESFRSIGIAKTNLIKSIVLGILLGVIFCTLYKITSTTNKTIVIISIASLISFIESLIIGFAEEIIFRGYFQTRLIAWQGTVKGCLITAIIFSFYHLPVNMVFMGMSLSNALLTCVKLIPFSLLFGYTMIKTKNIASVSILHAFVDLINL